MQLKSLELKHFRSYQEKSFVFSPQSTILLGSNTVGKTNILEAIFLTATGKSFRADREAEMIARKTDFARTKSRIILGDGPMDLEVIVSTGEIAGQKAPLKRFLVNGVARHMVDFVGNLRVVLFWPEDLELVTDSPTLRRRYLDFVLIQVDREYRRSLISYEKGLRQRNKLLESIRDGIAVRNQLLFWDQMLIKSGTYLTDKREEFINFINSSIKPFGAFIIQYDRSLITPARLKQYEREEIAAVATLVGPHRDDLMFFEGDRDLSKFGSRGEQRLSVLWLKLAELEFIAQKTGERPVLLLDDIFSELDHTHRVEVVKATRKQQTVVTTADRHFLPETLLQDAEVIELEKHETSYAR